MYKQFNLYAMVNKKSKLFSVEYLFLDSHILTSYIKCKMHWNFEQKKILSVDKTWIRNWTLKFLWSILHVHTAVIVLLCKYFLVHLKVRKCMPKYEYMKILFWLIIFISCKVKHVFSLFQKFKWFAFLKKYRWIELCKKKKKLYISSFMCWLCRPDDAIFFLPSLQ